jgi:hypothetical protein
MKTQTPPSSRQSTASSRAKSSLPSVVDEQPAANNEAAIAAASVREFRPDRLAVSARVGCVCGRFTGQVCPDGVDVQGDTDGKTGFRPSEGRVGTREATHEAPTTVSHDRRTWSAAASSSSRHVPLPPIRDRWSPASRKRPAPERARPLREPAARPVTERFERLTLRERRPPGPRGGRLQAFGRAVLDPQKRHG